MTVGPVIALEREVVDIAIRRLAGDAPVIDAGELTDDRADATALTDALRDAVGEESVVACVGVIEHLAAFSVVIETLVSLAAERRATVVLAVPNDAAHRGPMPSERPTKWTAGAVAELRRLVPSDHVVLDVIGLRGAALRAPGERVPLDETIEVQERPEGAAAFVVAFGPRARDLRPASVVAPADVRAERDLELARVAELDVLRSTLLVDGSGTRLLHPDGGP
jgi:hypothetical protein